MTAVRVDTLADAVVAAGLSPGPAGSGVVVSADPVVSTEPPPMG